MKDPNQLYPGWSAVEENHASTGVLPAGDTPEERVYLAQMRDWNARRAEALSMDEGADPLFKLRALTWRGRFQDSKKMISAICLPDGESARTPEILLEQARLAAFQNEWDACVELAAKALDLEPSSITRLTLHQVRSVAFFEMGAFQKAMDDLRAVESLSTLFPKHISAIYGSILRIRILAREQGVAMAQGKLVALWKNLLNKKELNQDLLIALLRADIDVNRLARKPFHTQALACFLIANAVGDRLYEALAVLDLCHCGWPEAGVAFEQVLSRERDEFKRIDCLLAEIEQKKFPATTSAKAITLGKSVIDHPVFASGLLERMHEIEHLIYPRCSLVIGLAPFELRRYDQSKQILKAVTTLSEGGNSKESFFKSIWGSQKYVSAMHDTLVYTMLFRLRKAIGVDVRCTEGSVEMPRTMVIEA